MAEETKEQKTTITGQQLVQLNQQERQRLEQVNSRISALQGAKMELLGTMEALTELGKNEKGNKILVNLGAGVFVEASVQDNENALAAIAGSIFKEKKNPDIIKLLDKRVESLDKQLEAIGKEQQAAIARVNQLESIMQAGAQYIRQQQEKAQQK